MISHIIPPDFSIHRPTRLGWLGLAASMLSFQPALADVFKPETFTLDNGLKVVVVSNHRAPVVSHMIWYPVGSADEPPGKSGVAHFLEHLMFKGTDTIGPGEFSEIVARNGGQDNAFTSFDYTAYYQNISRDRLGLVMQHEADRMRGLRLNKEVIEPERMVVLEERRGRVDNNPAAILREEMRAALFLNHPYGRPIIGWEDEIAALSLEDLTDFYDHHYAPNGAVVIISGDVTLDEAKDLAGTHYGLVAPSARRLIRSRPGEPAQRVSKRLSLTSPLAGRPSWRRLYLAPSYNRSEGLKAHAASILGEILGGGPTSRLYKKLVVEDKKAIQASAYYDGSAYDLGTFNVSASPADGVSLDDLETAIEAEITHLRRDGITQSELDRAKQRLQSAAIFAQDSLSHPGYTLGAALMTGRNIDDVEAWPERIGQVTLGDVMAVIENILSQPGHVTGELTPGTSS